MRKLSLRIGTRLAIVLATLGAVLVIIIAIGVTMLGRVKDSAAIIVEEQLPKAALSAGAREDVGNTALAMANLLYMESEVDRKAQFDRIEGSRKALGEKLAFLKQHIFKTNGEDLLRKALDLDAQYTAGVAHYCELVLGGSMTEAKTYLHNELDPLVNVYRATWQDMEQFYRSVMKEGNTSAAQTYFDCRNLMIGLGLAVLLFATVLGFWVTRSITRPLAGALKIASAIAAGDLSSYIEVDSTDEVGQLLEELKRMNSSLSDIVGDVRSGTEAIATASGQVAIGNLDLSSRTEQQASSLEETASSMEKLTAAVKTNADNAHRVNDMAIAASSLASKGGEIVSRAVATMGEINESSHKIVDIITVIDGIAFQTNILALNAAVEAARAGEQGRGFAVVASEVRSLAQRSAAAAKEIKVLIDNSVEKSSDGNKLVRQAGEIMGEIVISTGRVTNIMGELAVAAGEQTAGIEQINRAISELDNVTQQNAALVEEASAAARSMKDQADSLSRSVSVFKLPPMASKHASTGNLPLMVTISPSTGIATVPASHTTSTTRAYHQCTG